jgi:hypothetical protein
MMRLIIALLILVLASGVQFWLASGGVLFNLIFTTLIVFAFFFDFWEMAVFVLFGVLVVNWQPAMSVEIFLFALLPLLAFAFRNVFRSQRWATIPIAIAVGLLVFYLIVAPRFLLGSPVAFLEDLIGDLIAGGLVFLAMRRITKS